ncbi:MAG: hypothetical protein R3D88_02030 [Alphaproteobacteria bacterium]
MSKKLSESYLRYFIFKSKPNDLSELFIKQGAKVTIDENKFAEYLKEREPD